MQSLCNAIANLSNQTPFLIGLIVVASLTFVKILSNPFVFLENLLQVPSSNHRILAIQNNWEKHISNVAACGVHEVSEAYEERRGGFYLLLFPNLQAEWAPHGRAEYTNMCGDTRSRHIL